MVCEHFAALRGHSETRRPAGPRMELCCRDCASPSADLAEREGPMGVRGVRVRARRRWVAAIAVAGLVGVPAVAGRAAQAAGPPPVDPASAREQLEPVVATDAAEVPAR